MQNQIARDLLSIQAVFLRPDQPFTWASGIRSPIYTDNRLILTAPAVRKRVEEGLAQMVKSHFPETQVLMGTATAGIAHAAIVGHLLGLPMGYVRSASKDHGRQNRIEGRLDPGQKVLVIEDLVSTGKSVLETVASLREAGAQVLGVLAIFSYQMQKSKDRFQEEGLPLVSLTDFDSILELAQAEDYIKEEDIPRLKAFRDHPEDESWIQGVRP